MASELIIILMNVTCCLLTVAGIRTTLFMLWLSSQMWDKEKPLLEKTGEADGNLGYQEAVVCR